MVSIHHHDQIGVLQIGENQHGLIRRSVELNERLRSLTEVMTMNLTWRRAAASFCDVRLVSGSLQEGEESD